MSSGYKDKNVLVTGGLGFIGSNLSIRLVQLGARVTLVDSAEPGCGANLHNIAPVAGEVRLIRSDIADAASFSEAIAASELIFNLAGEISHIHSMKMPERDARVNAFAQLEFLQECARQAPGIRVVYAGTRQIYGIPEYLPVDEDHPVRPVDYNGIHKYAATMYHELLTRSGLLDAVVLRLTNVYGPRMALDNPCQGFLSNYLRKLTLGQPLEVFGDGRQLRDPLYVDDAVEAFLLLGLAPILPSRTYNVGGPEALAIGDIAETASRAAGVPPPVYRPFPAEQKAIDIGSYYTNWSRLQREMGWQPRTAFAAGIAHALDYCRRELRHYLDPSAGPLSCDLASPISEKIGVAV